jgi:thiol:disulfide interchange protein DsbA
MKKLLLMAAASMLLAACGAKNSESTSTSEGGAAETPASPPPAASTAVDPDKATQETSGGEDSAGDASLARIVAMPDNVRLPTGKWKAGVHYQPVVPAQNTSAQPGQVEVLEFLWLGCNHCADLEPSIVAWEKQKPDYVKFVQEHVLWEPVHRSHARLLYTLQALNRGDLVPKAFEEIHRRNNILVSRNGNEADSLSIQTAFAKANGVSEADFKREYGGFTVSARMKRAQEINLRYRVDTVPVIFINGKYKTDVSMAGGKQQLMQLITDLTAVEQSR